ncbi:hypothetical protein [Bacillus sp. S/N-304-OC-R1]|uniref:hypothetical protein n=1 Tax=Bacillus sp. S/N-304-OC-R1 TaxID=2758034 RepID=UPI001C8E32E9|nr:hypothetical protein [Bacillus sp. S/N-304-OC-R1]MBY0123518.1 hypothetical protein [Bacillus sp. S/N-304-OC-R1]
MSETAKLSQWTAILLERVRRFGLSDEVLLACSAAGDVTPLKIAEEQYYSYDEFFTYAKAHGEDLEAAIQNGYKMKFNTSGGIQTWLKERFELVPDRDYNFIPGKLTNITLKAAEAKILFNVLAGNWVMLIGADNNEYLADAQNLDAIANTEVVKVHLIIRSEYKASGE